MTEVIMMTDGVTDSAMESRARRAAKRVGLIALKSRWRANSIENYGEFRIVDPMTNFVVIGQGLCRTPKEGDST